jgi:hypothetical protein
VAAIQAIARWLWRDFTSLVVWTTCYVTLAVACNGCASRGRAADAPPPLVQTLHWSEFEAGRVGWERLAAAKFPAGCVVLYCHGTTDPSKPWRLCPDGARQSLDATAVAWTLHQVYAKPVVLVCCGNGQIPPVPGVWAAPRFVWQTPGPDWRWSMETRAQECGVGNLGEFKEGAEPLVSLSN